MAFDCQVHLDGGLAFAGSIKHRECGGSAESAAELASGYYYDALRLPPPCRELTVHVDFCGVRKSYRVRARVEFTAEEIPQADDAEVSRG